jgi:hypothetical protein
MAKPTKPWTPIIDTRVRDAHVDASVLKIDPDDAWWEQPPRNLGYFNCAGRYVVPSAVIIPFKRKR